MKTVEFYEKRISKLDKRIKRIDDSFLSKNAFVYESFVEKWVLSLQNKKNDCIKILCTLNEAEKRRLDAMGLCVTPEGVIIEKYVKKLCDFESEETKEPAFNHFRKLGMVVPRFDYKEKARIWRITPMGKAIVDNEEIRREMVAKSGKDAKSGQQAVSAGEQVSKAR